MSEETRMKIIVRHANNDFDALRVAQGMENAGASVFSVAHNGMYQPDGALIPSARFVVFGKYEGDEETRCNEIDKSISREFGEDDE
jgi:hypothetical protein